LATAIEATLLMPLKRSSEQRPKNTFCLYLRNEKLSYERSTIGELRLTPKPYSAKDVKPYLEEFLMDERVIDVPKWFRTFLVKGIILKTRPRRSAKAYKKIWWKEGSPLIVLSKRLQKKK